MFDEYGRFSDFSAAVFVATTMHDPALGYDVNVHERMVMEDFPGG